MYFFLMNINGYIPVFTEDHYIQNVRMNPSKKVLLNEVFKILISRERTTNAIIVVTNYTNDYHSIGDICNTTATGLKDKVNENGKKSTLSDG